MSTVIAQPLHLDSTLQELSLYKACVEATFTTTDSIQLFNEQPLLPGIILLEAGEFIGMISRRCFFERMSRPYSMELFSKKPVRSLHEFIQIEALMLDESTLIRVAMHQSLQRSPTLVYEPIVVKLQSSHAYCLLDIHQLLWAQSQIHELAIQALQQNQQALAQEKELAQITLHSIGDAVITTDAVGHIQSLNLAAEKLTGWNAATAQGLPLRQVFQVIDEHTRKPITTFAERVLQKEQPAALASQPLLIARDGREYSIADSAAPIRAKTGQVVGAVLVFHDMTQERHLARQVAWQASHDTLTGLMNRRAFEQQLEQIHSAVKTLKQAAVLCYLDLDRFKIVNDTCGHLAGDELLRQISCLLQSQVRQTDTLARLGGDEFGLLLDRCSLEQALAIAQCILQTVQDFRFVWQDKSFAIGVSIGITPIDASTPDTTSVWSKADAACYRAKYQGRNQVQLYEPDSDKLVPHSGTPWISQITRALKENRFQLYYQPIVPVTLVGEPPAYCEVLLRMLDETDTVVSPAVFMPTAERHNLMPEIDRWVIRNLFAMQSEARHSGGSHSLNGKDGSAYVCAVNLSGASFNDDHLIEFIREQLAFHQILPQQICFEITETVAIANLSKAAQFMRDLKQLGCRFALDDFGSGMSSFRYLKNLPVDYLKIDGSFIKDVVDDQIASAMVEAINRVGHVMGLKTVAEHVENDCVLAKIRELGVDYAQGYGIARPLPFMTSPVKNEVVSEAPGCTRVLLGL